MTTSVAPAENTAASRHPFDYYYRDGMELRPVPARAVPTDDWFAMRRRLFSRWIDVKPVPDETPYTRLLADHMWQGDELMDAVVGLGRRIGPTTLRDQFEQAVEHGIESLLDAPEELSALFDNLTRIPDWLDREAYERGRQLLVDCTPIGKSGGLIVNVIMTAYGEAVGSATGATGRLQRDPYRRQMETSAFFRSIPLPDGLEPYSTSFKMTARVRLMHAQVRAALRAKWGEDHFAQHGNPISNADMALGNAAYAAVNLLIDQSFGRTVTERDLDDVTMFWAYNVFRSGVSETVIPRSGRQAVELFDWCLASYGNSGPWAEEIAAALVNYSRELFTSSDNALLNSVVDRTLVPVFLGLIANLGKEPVGYGTAAAGGSNRRQLRRYEKMAVVAGNVMVRLAAVRDRMPGRAERMRRNAAEGDPFQNGSHVLLEKLAAKHGHQTATFRSHDHSTAADLSAKE